MARRLIDDTIFQSVKYNSLSDNFHKITYIHFLIGSDAWGRGDAEPMGLKLRMFPGFKENSDKVQAALEQLYEVGLVILYKDENERKIYQITNYDKYQNWNPKNRRGNSKFQGLPGNSNNKQCGTVRHSDYIDSDSDIDRDRDREKEKSLPVKKPPALSTLLIQYFTEQFTELSGLPPHQMSKSEVISINSNIKRLTKNDEKRYTLEYFKGLVDYCIEKRVTCLSAMLSATWMNGFEIDNPETTKPNQKSIVKEMAREREEQRLKWEAEHGKNEPTT